MTTSRIAAFVLACPDPEATAAFFRAAFGAGEDAPPPDGIALRLGRQRIEFAAAAGPAPEPAPSNSTAFQHLAIVVSDMAAAFAHLEGVEGWRPISRAGPERLPPASGGVAAFKFRDPDGHPLELLEFPEGAVPEAWRTRGASPFLGIEHTAITVADTGRAIAAYAELGFSATRRQVNRGPEQARMDGLERAVVEVTTLRPAGGGPPHLELLSYAEPGTSATTLPPGSPLATRTRLSVEGSTGERTGWTDPDGHRWTIGGPGGS